VGASERRIAFLWAPGEDAATVGLCQLPSSQMTENRQQLLSGVQQPIVVAQAQDHRFTIAPAHAVGVVV
jgi:hypothetical protein